MISVRSLGKRFGDVRAVDNLSFEILDGELFALLGSNGAGKSTTISCLTTTLTPDEGEIEINGYYIGHDDDAIRRDTGVVFQHSLLDPALTVIENLRLKADIYRIDYRRIDEVCELVAVTEFARRRYGILSGGEKRRVDIARGLLHRPSVMFLDEPTAGLDPKSRAQVWEAINRLRDENQMTVVLTTHYMEETEAADHVVVVDHGRLVTQGPPAELRARFSAPMLRVTAADQVSRRQLRTMLNRTRPGTWRDDDGVFTINVRDANAAIRVLDVYRAHLRDFEFVHGSMDDVFLNLLADQNGEPR
ncbi:MAG: ABC transporter ATP-binding protein [Propionibacteriaceae bacterium]|nr:ABC transporter ATP-binding protein [Propionibacteriaceae bacterium]